MSTATAAEGVARQRMWAAATWTVPGFLVLVPGVLVLLSFASAGEPVVWSICLLPLLLALAIRVIAPPVHGNGARGRPPFRAGLRRRRGLRGRRDGDAVTAAAQRTETDRSWHGPASVVAVVAGTLT